MLTALFELYVQKFPVYEGISAYADKIFTIITKTNPDKINNEMKSFYPGIDLFLKANYSDAINIFNEHIELYPLSGFTPTAHYMRAVCYSKLNEQEKSINELESFVAKYPLRLT